MNDNLLAIAVTETTSAMLWLGDQDGRCLFLSSALRQFWGVDPQTLGEFDWSSTLHPDDVELLGGPFRQAMANQTAFTVEARYRRADGQFRIMRTEASPRFDDQGRFLGMSGINTDVTDQRVAEERSHYLMGELNHRTKNLLSVVQAIARNTAKTTDPASFLDTFSARLMGLASSNDLLVAQDWRSVQLHDLVAGQFEIIGVSKDPRITFSGPSILVSPQHTQMLGMALHELATNSLKHGALAEPTGQLSVQWEIEAAGCWWIAWREELQRVIEAPERRGFGHVVMVDMVERVMGGRVQLDIGGSGLCWTLRVS